MFWHKYFDTVIQNDCAMEKSPTLLLCYNSPLSKGLDAVQHYLHDKKENLQDTISFFKDGITGKLGKAKTCINFITLPINNFIKDFRQIDREFEEEFKKNEEYCICLDGKMILATEVLEMKMEENY